MTGDPLDRAAELGRHVNGHPEHVDAALPELERLLTHAVTIGDDDLLWECLASLGHCWDPRAIRAVLARVDPAHPDPEIREVLADTLASWSAAEDPDLLDAVAPVLVRLTRDEVAEVRDWACFGLGQLEADSPAVRDALAARLDDPHVDTRCEALVALAARHDPRAVPATAKALAGDQDAVYTLELEAAIHLADPSLRPALVRLREAWREDDDDFTDAVDVALRVLEPTADVQQEIDEWIRRGLLRHQASEDEPAGDKPAGDEPAGAQPTGPRNTPSTAPAAQRSSDGQVTE